MRRGCIEFWHYSGVRPTWYDRSMANRITHLTFDCTDPAVLAAFWTQVLGWQVVERDTDTAQLIGADDALFRSTSWSCRTVRSEPRTGYTLTSVPPIGTRAPSSSGCSRSARNSHRRTTHDHARPTAETRCPASTDPQAASPRRRTEPAHPCAPTPQDPPTNHDQHGEAQRG